MKRRTHRLTDGTYWTSRMVADKLGCDLAIASARLGRSNDPAKVFAPVILRGSKMEKEGSKTIKRKREQRMYFDPLGHWKLINKYT